MDRLMFADDDDNDREILSEIIVRQLNSNCWSAGFAIKCSGTAVDLHIIGDIFDEAKPLGYEDFPQHTDGCGYSVG